MVTRIREPGVVDDGTQHSVGDRAQVHLVGGRIYEVKTMQANYTTYDMRRDYDIINPKKHADIISVTPDFDPTTASSPSGHPFRYARVLGIYHANVVYIQPGHEAVIETVFFLWVRWYHFDSSYNSGFQYCRLPRLSPVALDDTDACGFLDPAEVIRGAHLIPAFAHGKNSIVDNSSQLPWNFFYMNWWVFHFSFTMHMLLIPSDHSFVDRDIYMRFRGGGIGHIVPVDVPDPEPDKADVPGELDLGEEEMEVDGATTSATDSGRDEENSANNEQEDEEDEAEEDDADGEGVEDDDDDDESEEEDLLDDEGESGDEHDVEKIVDLMNDTLGYSTL